MKDLSPTEAAEILEVDVNTIKRWARAGMVPGCWRTPGGYWRFTREGLEQLMQSDAMKGNQ